MPRPLVTISSMFFDSDQVIKQLDRKSRRILSKFGAFTRRTAQTSMRDRKEPAKPGEPPHAHKRKQLKRLLFFAFDPVTKSVVVGPVKFERTSTAGIPRLMEEGGTVPATAKRKTPANYRPHPFMKPAFDKNIGWVADAYRE